MPICAGGVEFDGVVRLRDSVLCGEDWSASSLSAGQWWCRAVFVRGGRGLVVGGRDYGSAVPSARRPTVTEIHLHPVKSCRGHRVDSAVVSRYGLQGDREWQVQGPEGQMMNQRKFPGLARVRPVPTPSGLRLEHVDMPALDVRRPDEVNGDGKTLFGRVAVADAGDQAAAWFEQILGIRCRLTAIASGYQRRVVVGEDLFGQEVSLADAAPVHVVNAASFRFLLEHAAEPFEIERFRPNVVVDGFGSWEEDTWRLVSTATVEVDVVLPWPRCAIPQVDQQTGLRHREPAIVLKRYRWCSDAPSVPEAVRPLIAGNALFGVGASIRPEGAVIAVGDPVQVKATREPLVVVPN